MAKLTILIISCITVLLSCNKNGKQNPSTSSLRYKEKLFTTVSKTTIQFDNQPDYAGNATALFADFYTPDGDTASNRAAIIFVHRSRFTGGTATGKHLYYLFGCQLALPGKGDAPM